MAGIAVVTGAFGAHALEDMVTLDRLATWETAVQYQMYHALGLILMGILQKQIPESKLLGRAAVLLVGGIFIFSGSLYALVLTDTSWLGAITPIGGVAFIAGWVVLALAMIKTGKDS